MGNNINIDNSKEIQFLIDHKINPNVMKKWNDEQRKRLHRIMCGDDTNNIVKNITFDNEFTKFTDICTKWCNMSLNCVLFWNSYTNVKHLKTIRRQMSGLCFMHAPVVLQHYMYNIYLQDKSELKMIDVAKYIKKYWVGNKMLDYLERDSGGRSEDFLKEITNNKCKTVIYVIPEENTQLSDTICDIILNMLKTKPAIVSEFKIDKNFHQKGLSFNGKINNNEVIGLHSMLLVGGLKDNNGKYFFLLQNWWSNRYFIEVSSEYLCSSECKISFISNDITEIPDEFPYVCSSYAETSIDAQETVHEM
jgi:hypothetical protein